MDFWDTAYGLKIAELLEDYLIKKNNSSQYTVVSEDKKNLDKILNEEFKKGSRYIDSIEISESKTILIFEK